jgi:phospholipid/cholesterol/gamma-HCH transport system ATP-binding protein
MKSKNNNGKPAIRVRDLNKSFGEQKVLYGFNLEVARGETVTMLGRSGSGKSVMLKLIIGLQSPDGGEIEINGEEITSLSYDELNRVRKNVGFLFQGAALYDSLTVEENVGFPLLRHATMKKDECDERVRELLASVGMEDASKKMPADISGGMKKRVGLARALALDPEIMLMDEPTAGLDPITAGEINELIRKLQSERNTSSIVVTHDMRSVQTVADRVALLNEGSIMIQGSLEDLKQSDDQFVSTFIKQCTEVSDV